jgi:hypothetical protein
MLAPHVIFPVARFTPFEDFPSLAAVPHHCGRCPLGVRLGRRSLVDLTAYAALVDSGLTCASRVRRPTPACQMTATTSNLWRMPGHGPSIASTSAVTSARLPRLPLAHSLLGPTDAFLRRKPPSPCLYLPAPPCGPSRFFHTPANLGGSMMRFPNRLRRQWPLISSVKSGCPLSLRSCQRRLW